jgi:hypothetical protein
MKKIIIAFLVLNLVICIGCGSSTGENVKVAVNDKNSVGKSEIVFREYEHSFGKVSEGEKLSYTFAYDNKGTSDLVISAVSTTCGCTVPRYDKKPIAPGSGGTIEVVFDTSGKAGTQTKTITVKSNASIPVVILKITAEVVSNNQ